MTEKEYLKIKKDLMKKIHKGSCITNREDGYNDGILTAISKVREIYI